MPLPNILIPSPMYTKPTLERLGTLREITRAGAEFACADGSNPYHRYAACTP